MMVSTCSNELKFMSERERSTKPALNGYTNPDFRELRPVDPSDGVPLSRTRANSIPRYRRLRAQLSFGYGGSFRGFDMSSGHRLQSHLAVGM